MTTRHTITKRDRWFLNKQMKDPIAQEPFKIGDTIVICAKCKTAHYDSTWSMNSNKCCSMGCNHSSKLSFNKFSPVIFQPKVTHSSRFSVIVEKLPFAERLKMFNGYPLANVFTILLPIIVVGMLFYATQYQVVPTFNASDQILVTQSKLTTLSEDMEEKVEYFSDKATAIQSKLTTLSEDMEKKVEYFSDKATAIDVNFGDMNYKFDKVTSSFTTISPNIKKADVEDKFSNSIENLSTTARHAGGKLSTFFSSISDFVSNIFDD